MSIEMFDWSKRSAGHFKLEPHYCIHHRPQTTLKKYFIVEISWKWTMEINAGCGG